jgi:hypothetical protein
MPAVTTHSKDSPYLQRARAKLSIVKKVSRFPVQLADGCRGHLAAREAVRVAVASLPVLLRGMCDFIRLHLLCVRALSPLLLGLQAAAQCTRDRCCYL